MGQMECTLGFAERRVSGRTPKFDYGCRCRHRWISSRCAQEMGIWKRRDPGLGQGKGEGDYLCARELLRECHVLESLPAMPTATRDGTGLGHAGQVGSRSVMRCVAV